MKSIFKVSVDLVDVLLLFGLMIKALLRGVPTFSEGIVLVGFMGYISFYRKLIHNKKYEELFARVEEDGKRYVDVINKQNEVLAKMATEVDNVKTSFSGLKLSQGYRKMSGSNTAGASSIYE